MEQQNKPKEKLTDKAFSRLVLTSILGILVCIICLCSTTYAWFSGEKKSEQNTINSGKFDLTVSVTKVGDTTVIDPTNPGADDGVWEYDLPAGKYTVTLKATAETTVKGHCVVTIGNGTAKHTDAIINDYCAAKQGLPKSDPFVFEIEVEAAADQTTRVVIKSQWGIAVNPDISNTVASTPYTSEVTTEETTDETTVESTDESTEVSTEESTEVSTEETT